LYELRRHLLLVWAAKEVNFQIDLPLAFSLSFFTYFYGILINFMSGKRKDRLPRETIEKISKKNVKSVIG